MSEHDSNKQRGYGDRPDPYAPPAEGGSATGSTPYGQPQYGQNPYGQNPYGQNQYGQNPYGQSQYGQNPSGQPAPGGPAYNPYPAGGPYYPGVENRTNDKATWSLICGIASFFCLSILAGIPAIILGVLARSEIKRGGNRQEGSGMALAGIILGVVSVVLFVAGVIALIVLAAHINTYDYPSYDPSGFPTDFSTDFGTPDPSF